jgi:hypothetical protein
MLTVVSGCRANASATNGFYVLRKFGGGHLEFSNFINNTEPRPVYGTWCDFEFPAAGPHRRYSDVLFKDV